MYIYVVVWKQPVIQDIVQQSAQCFHIPVYTPTIHCNDYLEMNSVRTNYILVVYLASMNECSVTISYWRRHSVFITNYGSP